VRSVKEASWEQTISRYFAAVGIPLRWEGLRKRFQGIAGHEFARLNPKSNKNEAVWTRMPEYVKKYERLADGKQVVVFVTNRGYGDSVDDSLVVLRMGTFAPMLKAFIETDKERWTRESSND